MKILLIPLDWHRTDYFANLLATFNEKCEATLYNGLEQAIAFKPDVVWFQGGISKEDCIQLKTQTCCLFTMWTGDMGYAPPQHFMDMREVVDLFLLPFTGQLSSDYSTLLHKPCKFLWEPIYNNRFKEPKIVTDGNIVFVGNGYETLPGGEARVDITAYLQKHIGCEVYGSLPYSNGTLPYEEVPDVYNNAFTVLADNNYLDTESYFTMRNLSGMAAGSCTLMRRFPKIEDYFPNWETCIHFTHKHELLQHIQFLKRNPDVRNEIAVKGHEFAMSNFSLDVYVDTFIRIVEQY